MVIFAQFTLNCGPMSAHKGCRLMGPAIFGSLALRSFLGSLHFWVLKQCVVPIVILPWGLWLQWWGPPMLHGLFEGTLAILNPGCPITSCLAARGADRCWLVSFFVSPRSRLKGVRPCTFCHKGILGRFMKLRAANTGALRYWTNNKGSKPWVTSGFWGSRLLRADPRCSRKGCW